MTTKTIPEYLEDEGRNRADTELRTEEEAARIQPLRHGHHRTPKPPQPELAAPVEAVAKAGKTTIAKTRKPAAAKTRKPVAAKARKPAAAKARKPAAAKTRKPAAATRRKPRPARKTGTKVRTMK
jgi:hypothetical protein